MVILHIKIKKGFRERKINEVQKCEGVGGIYSGAILSGRGGDVLIVRLYQGEGVGCSLPCKAHEIPMEDSMHG